MEGLNGNMDHGLLAKYLAGEATQAEMKLVEEWRAMSSENAREYRKFEALWDASMAVQSSGNSAYQADKAWKKVATRIGGQVASGKTIRSFTLVPYLLRVAAVVTIAMAAYFIYNAMRTDYVEVMADESPVSHPLPDGSTVALRQGATIAYEEGFNTKARVVKLQGKAFFEVEKEPERPFSVELDGTKVVVLGTSFQIHNEAADSLTEVIVVTGKVAFIALHSRDTMLLLPGQRGIYNKHTAKFEAVGTLRENALFWKTNTLAFRNERIADVIATLHDAFGKEITIENGEILECRFTGRFSDQSLEGILEHLALSFGWKVTFGTTITIEGKGC